MPGTFSPATDFKGNRRASCTCRGACRDRLLAVARKCSRHSRRMRIRNFTYLVRGPWGSAIKDTRPKLIWNSNLEKKPLTITYLSVNKSLCNFAQRTAVSDIIVLCVKFQNDGQLKLAVWTRFLRYLNIRISYGYVILHNPIGFKNWFYALLWFRYIDP